MSPRLYLVSLLRETRGAGGRMAFFTVCLAVGVAAVVSVAGLSASLDEGIRSQARQLLAADLAVSGRRAVPEVVDRRLRESGAVARVSVQETVTVVAAPPAADGTPGRSQLVEIKAVGPATAPRAEPEAGAPGPNPGGGRDDGPDRDDTTALDHADSSGTEDPDGGESVSTVAGRGGAAPAGSATPSGPDEARWAGSEADASGAVAADPGAADSAASDLLATGYPFYGTLELDSDRPLQDLLSTSTVVVAPDLLARLGLAVGDELRVGGEPFRIAGTVLAEPDNLSTGLAAGPRVFLSLAGLERAGLVQKGSRVRHRVLAAMPPDTSPETLAATAAGLREELGVAWDVETWREAQPSVRDGVWRVDRFLGLVALLSLLVGGIGVAQTVRAWLAGRLDAIAVLKCLGVRPREVLTLYLGQTVLLGLAGSVLGMVAGVAVQLALPHLFPDLIPAELVRPFQPGALARGLLLGMGVAVLFSVPPLATALRVPPSRVLRRDADPLPMSRWAYGAAALALVGGVAAMAALQARSLVLGLQFTGGLVAMALVLAGAGRLLIAAVSRLPTGASRGAGGAGRTRGALWLRHGLTALARPSSGTLSGVVALGLGTLVVLGMALVERHLVSELDADLPANAPSAFLVDVQPDQWEGVHRLLLDEGAEDVDSVPVVMARITSIDGQGLEELAAEAGADAEPAAAPPLGARNTMPDRPEHDRPVDPEGAEADRPAAADDDELPEDRRWALTREQRLTYMDALPEDNEVVAGALWQAEGVDEVSVEADFARDLGVDLGSRLVFDVQGVPLELTVTSLRTVDWGTFGINFFLVVEPGVLERAPQQRLAAVRLPPGSEQRVQDRMAAAYPNVTLIQIRAILEKIVAVLQRISLAVRFLGGFTVLAGIAILAGAVSASAARRGREVALLKTLGFTRAGVAAVFSVEYAAVGLVAGALGSLGGGALAWSVLTHGMELEWTWFPVPFTAALVGMVLLAVVGGLAASAGALRRRPIEVLREE